jgi:hypothetical protein
MTWRGGVLFGECKNDQTSLAGFETYATFSFMSSQGPVFGAHCGLPVDVL